MAAVEYHAQRLVVGRHVVVVADGKLRVVGKRRPDSDDDGVDGRAQPVHVGPRRCTGDPPAGAVGRGDPPVEGARDLPDDVRPCRVTRVQPRPQRAALGRSACSTPSTTSTPAARSRPGAAGGRPVRVGDGDDDAGDSGGDQRVGARPGAAGVCARFQGDDGGAAAGALAGLRERPDLGVRAAGRRRRALADERRRRHRG